MKRKGDSIETFTGVEFWPLDPRPEEIRIEDIAHALSNQCRFSGHTSTFYSVAQHSVLVAQHSDKPDQLWGLLHDASEAYLVDLPRPLKHLPEFDVYRNTEHGLMRCICQRFNLPDAEPPSVRRADNSMLLTEKRDLMPGNHQTWKSTWSPASLQADAYPERITTWEPATAELLFLRAFTNLTTEVGDENLSDFGWVDGRRAPSADSRK